MKSLSQVSQVVTPSPIREMFNKAIGMEDVISFTVGEPDFQTPDNIVEAAVKALRNGEHKYTPNAGILPLRKAIAKSTKESHGIDYSPENQVIVTAGGMEALILAMLTILDEKDEFILGDPCWTNYSRQILICKATPKFVKVKAENSFTFDPEDLENAITDKTKAILINSPANPTGGIASKELLEEIAKIAVAHDLYVISDEVYNRLVYGNKRPCSIASLPGMAERTIIINSFSKTYAMTGWRVGYALGPSEIIGNMVKLQENVAACVNSAAQYGALAALEDSQEAVDSMVQSYARRRELIVNEFSTIPVLHCYEPQGAFYAFVDISETGMKASEFASDLLEKARVIVVPGHAFGEDSDRYIRLSFATSDEAIREGCARIRGYMKKNFG
ncbi:MAG: pyridoxal phosphate-dependent aminotransferase [Lachnospiraceae bacterium]|nr:pyridoxal phosphate-dependent aminotransferase [Lachnospiraceae bacterium]